MERLKSCCASVWRRCAVLAPLAVAATLTGCAVGPDYERPSFTHQEQWNSELKMTTELAESALARWWQRFDDPVLDALVTQATSYNGDLAVALANIERARSLRRMESSTLYPSLAAEAGVERNRFSSQSSSARSSGVRNTFDASLDAAWELDIFGRARRSVEAAEARLQAAVEIKRDVVVSMIAELAGSYFQLRGLQRRIAVTRLNIALLQEVEGLAQAQFEAGVVSEFDVARARGEREAIEALLPNLEAEMMAQIYRISVLTGQPPEYHVGILEASEPLPMPPDQVPVGLRSDLLKRRPDILQAERELAASVASIGIAKADLFPSLSLTGAVGSSARLFSDLFTANTLTYSLGSTIKWSVFEWGKRLANVEVAEAEAKAALAAYEQAVLLALEDAESALIRYGKEWQTLSRLRDAEVTRKDAFEIAKLRYEVGEENFLVILDADRALINVRNDIIQSETRILTSLTQVYKALGGGWQQLEGSID